MSTPVSPPPVTSSGSHELPPYVSNGLIGLRVLDIPLLPGIALVNGFAGVHPTLLVPEAAQAPYPIAGDIRIDGVWLSTSTQQADFIDQRYDFATGELTTRFRYRAEGTTATVEVLTFCSRKQPTLVLQQVSVEVDASCELVLRAMVDVSKLHGRSVSRHMDPPGRDEEAADGSMTWESLGGKARCGIAHVTEFLGDADAIKARPDWGRESSLATDHTVDAKPGRTYRLRQVASMLPDVMHHDPEQAAIRLASRAASAGFDSLRDENHREWEELWNGRIIVDSDDDLWQQLTDAAFFYLNTSAHPSAPSSTSIYGLARWNDYHYYYGHVMWDIETFTVPSLLFLQPDAAYALLEFRRQTIPAARSTAKLLGRRGLQFPWESDPINGEEAAPGAGAASWHEDHVSLDVARAFIDYGHATGDLRFLADDAAPILYGVADWITSRVSRDGDGFAFRETMGIAERKKAADNDAFTLMSSITVLRRAIELAERLGHEVPPAWREVAAGLRVRPSAENGAIMSHDRYNPNEEKGATPGPLAGIFPVWFDLDPKVAQRTLDYYLDLAPGYIGSPMLSSFYGVWAAWAGDRRRSLRLLHEGYAELIGPRFLQTLEQHPTKYPEKPPSGPFFANLGAYLMSLLYGFPGIRLGSADPSEWPCRPVVLPAGWKSIEVERAWIRREPARIVARHGAERAVIEPHAARRRRAA
jgi:trehalose/maltose hydrolase-like predicted phosphorylase